jgi:hypothetical protein
MGSFASKYPAIAALLAIMSSGVQSAEVPNETIVQKLEGSIGMIPQILAFIPQVSAIGSEIAALKSSPSELEAGAELLVSDLAFTSEKAKAIIAAVFPLADSLIALLPQVKALASAIG